MRWGILAFLFVAIFINFVDKSLIGYAAGPIMKEFNLSYVQWGLVGSSFFWLFSIAGVFGAGLSDRIGSKKMLSILLMSWAVLQFGAYAIVGFPILILYRVLLGIGEGPFTPTGYAHLKKWFPPQSRGIAFSIFNSGATLGALISAPIIVAMIENLGWRTAFASLGLLSFVWVILWVLIAKEKPKGSMGWSEPSSPSGKLKWSEISSIILTPTCILVLFTCFASFWFSTWSAVWLPTYLVKVVGLTPMEMGYAAVAIGIAGAVISILVSYVSDRLYKKSRNNRKSRVFIGAITMIIGALFLSSSMLSKSAVLTVALLCLSKGFIVAVLAITPQILIHLLPERSGLMSSLGTSFMNFSGMISPIVSGYLLKLAGDNTTLGFNYTFLCNIGLLVIVAILFSIFARPDKPKKTMGTSAGVFQ
ncbi:putative MFS family arabinose efflux permease [Scopulibacillus darangshiensis]|uniref:Putative MFS family arabinose efflux permease n=1 Tax=Scopulibacillus darangshiensis TaxID=442528 RepID=A0A4R2NW21_9BACL|nr:MFS transporter [Scopulibacillus darangshiensis]TCP25615.1 putative MFS family arabinose efflux permease [Scopulibacillus darangshiensis]